jgi:hypothetical protein
MSGYDRDGYDRSGFDRRGFNKEGYTVDGSRYDKEGYDKYGYNAEGFDKAGYDKASYDKKGYNRNGRDRSGNERWSYKRWSPLSTALEILYTVRPGFNDGASHGLTAGLIGVYCSLSFDMGEPNDNGTETTKPDTSLGEFVIGYTLNLLSRTNGNRSWGLGLPLGVGWNNLENQLVVEAGLQLRFLAFEIRGTYRTIGFKDSSFTLSVGICVSSSAMGL